MLVLSRQRDETIMIGDDTEITIVDIRGDKVRLGITAPRQIQVHRKEVYDAIRRENAEASQAQFEQDLPLADQQLRCQQVSQDNHPGAATVEPRPNCSCSKHSSPHRTAGEKRSRGQRDQATPRRLAS